MPSVRDDVSQVLDGWKHKSTYAFFRWSPAFSRRFEAPPEAKMLLGSSCEENVIEIHRDMFQSLQYVFNCLLKDSQGVDETPNQRWLN